MAAACCAPVLRAQDLPPSANFQDLQPSTRPAENPLPLQQTQPLQALPKPPAQNPPLQDSSANTPQPSDHSPDPQLKQNPLTMLREFQPDADEEYRLGRGDEITVDFAGRPDLQAKLVIGPDGRITIPLVGDIVLNGRTRGEAARAIETALATYYQNLTAQVTVTKYTANHVLVLGAVDKPGLITFDGQPTLLEALSRAGMAPGPPPHAGGLIPERCAIYRGQDKVVWVDVKKLIDSGNSLADLRLRRDDVVYVPNAAESFVSVLGEVGHPGAVPLSGTSTLASVLAESGGFTVKAGNNPHIQIVDPSSGVSRTVSFHDLLNPVKAREFTLKPGEILYVPQTGFARATYVLERLNPVMTAFTFAAVAGGIF
jgi:polysaccharide export outer membrane protein